MRLFIEKGYNNTTVAEIMSEADVTSSTFQNIFRSKVGVLTELVEVMFVNQFAMSNEIANEDDMSVYSYAVEIAVQLALVEINDNLRDIYVEAYTDPETAMLIQKKNLPKSMSIFKKYVPHFTESDYYETDIGLCGIMRNYMERKCDLYFTFERKIRRIIHLCLSAYEVPKDERNAVVDYVLKINVKKQATDVMHSLFESLAMKYELPETK